MIRRAPEPVTAPEEAVRAVFGYFAFMVGDGTDADYFTRAAFARAFRDRHSSEAGRAPLLVRLIESARRSLVDHLGAIPALAPGDLEDVVVPESTVVQAVDEFAVRDAVAALEPRDRELVALRYGAGLPVEKIGTLFGLRADAVEAALGGVRGRLQRELARRHHPAAGMQPIALGDLLRRSRPEAPLPLLEALVPRIPPERPRERSLRGVARGAVFSIAVIAALASIGGLGYAMSVATSIVAGAKSHSTYAQQSALRTLVVDAAVAQYGTTTTTTATTTTTTSGGGGGGGIGPAPTLASASPGDGDTVQSLSSFELIASTYVDWFDLRVTRPDNTVATLDSRQGTSQIWSFAATAAGLYTISGSINANNGSGNVQFATHFTIYVPSSGGTPPPAEATASPTQPGSVTAPDATASVTWPAGAFTQPVIVQVAPEPTTVIQNLPAGSLVVKVTATTLGTGAPVTALNAVIEIQFPHAAPNAVPMASDDGLTWRLVPALSVPQLPAGQADGYFRDSGGTVHLYTRHLTYFALAPRAPQTSLSLISPTRIWTAGRDFVAIRVTLDLPAKITTRWFTTSGRLVPNSTVTTRTLPVGTTILRLHLRPLRLSAGTYRVDLRAAEAGRVAVGTVRIRVSTQPPALPAPSASHPVGVVVVQGARVASLGTLGTALGSGFSVSTVLDSLLFGAVDPRVAHVGVVVVDLDRVPTAEVAALHAVLPELQIIGLTSYTQTARNGRQAGAAIVIAKPVSVSVLARTIRAFVSPNR